MDRVDAIALTVVGTPVAALVLVNVISIVAARVRLARRSCPGCGAAFGGAAIRDAVRRRNAEIKMDTPPDPPGEMSFNIYDWSIEVTCKRCGHVTKIDSPSI